MYRVHRSPPLQAPSCSLVPRTPGQDHKHAATTTGTRSPSLGRRGWVCVHYWARWACYAGLGAGCTRRGQKKVSVSLRLSTTRISWVCPRSHKPVPLVVHDSLVSGNVEHQLALASAKVLAVSTDMAFRGNAKQPTAERGMVIQEWHLALALVCARACLCQREREGRGASMCALYMRVSASFAWISNPAHVVFPALECRTRANRLLCFFPAACFRWNFREIAGDFRCMLSDRRGSSHTAGSTYRVPLFCKDKSCGNCMAGVHLHYYCK